MPAAGPDSRGSQFLHAMEKAGVPCGREIDRMPISISHDEACRVRPRVATPVHIHTYAPSPLAAPGRAAAPGRTACTAWRLLPCTLAHLDSLRTVCAQSPVWRSQIVGFFDKVRATGAQLSTAGATARAPQPTRALFARLLSSRAQDGDGRLSLSEFMSVLQSTKTSVLATNRLL